MSINRGEFRSGVFSDICRSRSGALPSFILHFIFSALALASAANVSLAGNSSVAPSCSDKVSTTASASEPLGTPSSQSAAREAAIRRAILNAALQVGGIQIRHSFNFTEGSTLDRVTFDSQMNTLMRTNARVLKWSVVRETVEDGDAGHKSLVVVIDAEVCKNAAKNVPLIVAFDFLQDQHVETRGYRELMGSLFPVSNNYELALRRSTSAYYDILVSGTVLSADASEYDRTSEIEIIRRYQNRNIDHLARKVLRLRVSVQVKAETFLGGAELVDVQNRTRDVSIDTNVSSDLRDLVEIALRAAANNLYRKLLRQ